MEGTGVKEGEDGKKGKENRERESINGPEYTPRLHAFTQDTCL